MLSIYNLSRFLHLVLMMSLLHHLFKPLTKQREFTIR